MVDTTGSMGDVIGSVRVSLASLVAQLAAATSDFRVAVVSYKDFPERCSGDYPSRVDQDFTNNLALIQAGLDSLVADGGCDGECMVDVFCYCLTHNRPRDGLLRH